MVVLSDVVDADGNVDDADADGADGNADADDRVMLAGLPARDQLAADTGTQGGYLWTHHHGKWSNIDNHNMWSSIIMASDLHQIQQARKSSEDAVAR